MQGQNRDVQISGGPIDVGRLLNVSMLAPQPALLAWLDAVGGQLRQELPATISSDWIMGVT